MNTEIKLWSRQCSVTGEGMNEGWVWGEGAFYTKYEEDTIKELRADYESSIGAQTDDELLDWAFNEDLLYFTEWDDSDDMQYQETNGVLTENENY